MAAALAGWLEARAVAAGHDSGMADATIAGIAKAHDVTIVTRNNKHFQVSGVEVVSPDEATQSG
jgi:predicted nucleic acid-binding protein